MAEKCFIICHELIATRDNLNSTGHNMKLSLVTSGDFIVQTSGINVVLNCWLANYFLDGYLQCSRLCCRPWEGRRGGSVPFFDRITKGPM